MATNLKLHSLFSGCSATFEKAMKKWMNNIDTAKQAVGFPYAFKSTAGVDGEMSYARKDGREIIGEIVNGSVFSRVEGCRFYLDKARYKGLVSPHLIHRPYYYTYGYLLAYLIIYGEELFGENMYSYLHNNLVNCLERLMSTIHPEAFQDLQKAIISILRNDRVAQENLNSTYPKSIDDVDAEKRAVIMAKMKYMYANQQKSPEARERIKRDAEGEFILSNIGIDDITAVNEEYREFYIHFDDVEPKKLDKEPTTMIVNIKNNYGAVAENML